MNFSSLGLKLKLKFEILWNIRIIEFRINQVLLYMVYVPYESWIAV
jgi:hypothetical protein